MAEKEPHILVLMATHNGQAFINQQLKSILGQRGVKVTLRVSDDCSTDNTYRILETFASEHSNMELRYNGQREGVDRTLMGLVYDADPDAYDYVAFADQDGIWHPRKLVIAAQHISSNTSRPELYCADARTVDERGRTLGFALQPYRACSTHPASLLLVRNWCLGCTMLANGALVKLLRAHPVYDFGRSYDTWIHAVCLYCSGLVFPDLDHSYAKKRVLERGEEHESAKQRTDLAAALLREYGDEMLPETRGLVADVANRQTSLAARVRLWHSHDIVAPTRLDTTKLRWKLLFNRF